MKNPKQASSMDLVQRLWSYCHILRDDGMSYGDYVEQLTFLLFLKMADEHSKPPFLHLAPLPKSHSWSNLVTKRDEDQLDCYERTLRHLGRRADLFGSIYRNALSKFRDPAKFQRVVAEIDSIAWSMFDSDIKGQAYEELLERTAAEGKSGAGQYFTPRPLVDAMVEVISPRPGDAVCDPACGTGGFLLAFHRVLAAKPQKGASRRQLAEEAIRGTELVESVARLCLMNLVLHGIGGRENPISVEDSLVSVPSKRFDVVLANPPFGKKGSTAGNGVKDGSKDGRGYNRKDFWARTSNKQLNFLQHIFALLKDGGRAAVVLPDNVLFEGGAGEVVRRELLKRADVHTLLRLPTGIFYAAGVKANVLFFDKKPERSAPWTSKLWVPFHSRDRPPIVLQLRHPLFRSQEDRVIPRTLPIVLRLVEVSKGCASTPAAT
jgi:type I restriction enzyme M protein